MVEKAGLTVWPKLFQNLRSTRETELAELYPVQVVCAWIGNSPAVAAKHYLQVTDEHFSKAVHFPVQYDAAEERIESRSDTEDDRNPVKDAPNECRKRLSLGDTGLEPNGVSGESDKCLQNQPQRGGAVSGAESGVSGDFDADLRKVIDAWPTLPETVRQNILAMVEASQVKK